MIDTNHTHTAALFTEIILETFKFNGRLITAGDALTKPFGLTSALWQVMGAIKETPIPMAQIARNMGLSRQGVRRSTHVLIDKGLVRFEENPDHKRAKRVALTDKGRDAFRQLEKTQITWSNAVAKEFSGEELKTALRVIRTLGEKL